MSAGWLEKLGQSGITQKLFKQFSFTYNHLHDETQTVSIITSH